MATEFPTSPPAARSIETQRFDTPVPYQQAFDMQRARCGEIEAGRAGNLLMLLEHPPVFTLGRRSDPNNILLNASQLREKGIELHYVDRGGDVTYHGPGQLVAYPILDLSQWRLSIRWYLRSLEEVLVRLVARYDLPGERLDGFSGVWVRGAKVAAIGVGIHNWVTFHGIALNVAPNMTHFTHIIPCGITDKPVTSLRQLLGDAPPMNEVMTAFDEEFRSYFLDQPPS
ncbi:MAG: lipoyl(octanoyl) transferase LipB [Candidatus Hydrogenedentes bacterium]|nr:lipoyl(octanoyl) transferase LipB [Candidatus Hydrogenedentota bacterium]